MGADASTDTTRVLKNDKEINLESVEADTPCDHEQVQAGDPENETEAIPDNDPTESEYYDVVGNLSDTTSQSEEHELDVSSIFSSIKTDTLDYLNRIKNNNFIHNKPKKNPSTVIVPQDYICNQDDIDTIEPIRNLPSKPGREIVVRINDCFVDRMHFDCLLQPGEYLNDEVIDAYIALIRAQEHLKHRTGGSAYLETACISQVLKRDGSKKVKMVNMYPRRDEREIQFLKKRICNYLNHDMVFIPINIKEKHWYLAVVNARNCEIQVLDSMGVVFGRKDLRIVLKGLQRQINILSKYKELKNHKWTNLKVETWPIREICFKGEMQTDLIMWPLYVKLHGILDRGNIDRITQDDMTQFRTKLAAILLASELNANKGCPTLENDDDDSGNPCDVQLLEGPTNLHSASQQSLDSNIKHPNDNASSEQAFKKRKGGFPVQDMPRDKEELIDALCTHILSIDDAKILETIWVASSKPFQISLSLKNLQASLKLDQPMFNEIFDISVRILAYTEYNKLKSNNLKVSNHYMDLQFCKNCKDSNPQKLAKSLEGWPFVKYDVSRCASILMPYAHIGCFMLFVLNHEERTVYLLDSTPTPEWCDDLPYKWYVCRILSIAKNYRIAMSVAQPTWSGDIFRWNHVILPGTPVDVDGYLSGWQYTAKEVALKPAIV
ncbi:hypothetical protein ACP4OV_027267 [Aristida adscensionis]